MPVSKNIKIDYGATGDVQLLSAATISITSGTNDLVVSGNNFATDGSENGKYIIAEGAGSGANSCLFTTITSAGAFSGGVQHITLGANATHTLSSATKRVEWGHDDCQAFIDCQADNIGNDLTLTIPSGRYWFLFSGGSGPGIFFQIPTLTVNCGTSGNGVVFSDGMANGCGFFLGGSHGQREKGLTSDDPYSARTATVTAGISSVALLDTSKTSLFGVGDWAKMTGWDAQDDQSYPSNQSFTEFKQIASKSGVSGEIITFTSPLTFSYKSTWPVWYAGDNGHADMGGPATLYKLMAGWDCDHTYNDLLLDVWGALVDAVGRNIIFNNTTCKPGSFSIYPSRCKVWTANNLVTTGTQFVTEFDKFNDEAHFTGGTVRAPKAFSASTGKLYMTDVHVTDQFNGTPREAYLDGCTVDPAMWVGPISFGTAALFSASNTAFNLGFDKGGVVEDDILGVGAYSFSNGTFTRSQAGGSAEPPQWSQPGGWCFLEGVNFFAYVFQVTDVSVSGGNIVISTNLPSNVFTTVPANASGKWAIRTHPAVDFTLTGCTGSPQALAWSNVLAHRPMYERWKQTYNAARSSFAGGANIEYVTVAGNLRSSDFGIRVNVTKAYSGSGALSLNLGGPFVLIPGSRTIWNPTFDLRTTGERRISLAGATGTAGADANLMPPDSTRTWLLMDQILLGLSKSIAADDPSLWPAFELEFSLDQGIPGSGNRSFVCSFV